MNNKLFQLTVFCDLTKAFDTISHSILLNKLYCYGIRGNAHNWYKSYLSHRKQYTTYNNVSSPCNNITCGLPQGSILGHILFLIYTNDVTRSSNFFFPDNTTISIQGSSLESITHTLNTELSKVLNCIKSNKLTLNINTTNFMVSSSLMSQPTYTSVTTDNVTLNEVTEFRFLGVLIDRKLKWKEHIDMLKSKKSE